MKGTLLLAKREFLSLWQGPLAWSLLVLFSLVQGGIFASLVQGSGEQVAASPLYAYYGQDSLLMAMSLLLLCPSLCMRSLAEERRSGGYEVLLSSPLTNGAITLGKFLGPLATYALIWAVTLAYPLSLAGAETIDWARIACSYLAILLIGTAQLSLSLFASAFARNQLTALLFASMAIFGQYVFSLGEFLYPDGPLRALATALSFATFLDEAARGILDFRRIFLNCSVSVAFLAATTAVVETWRDE